MPEFSTLHNELRLRVPDKTFEIYDDALRWAVDYICKKTSCWQVTSKVLTKPGKSVYYLMLPAYAAAHSMLYAVQHGNVDRIIERPVNGFIMTPNQPKGDYLRAFKTHDPESVQITPVPKNGNVEISFTMAVKPKVGATGSDYDKFFSEYKDTVIYGALLRLYELDRDFEQAMYNRTEFKNGISEIHTDVLKENANTPMKICAKW